MKEKLHPFLTYLASPYSHPDPAIRRRRFELAVKATAKLFELHPSWNIFSPIVHSAPLHDLGGMKGEWGFWSRVDRQYLRASCRVVVLTIEGWRESIGVQAEIKIAHQFKIPLSYLELDFPVGVCANL